MVIPKEREKKEGLIGTILFHVLLLLFFLYYGLTYQVPMPETGLTVNFGTSDMGMGELQPDVTGEQPKPQPEPVEEVVPVTSNSDPADASQDVATQDDVETIEAPKEKSPEEIEAEKAAKKAAEEKAQKEREEEAFREKMAQTTNAFNNKNTKAGGGEGPDDTPGDKGQTDGQKNGGAYTGKGHGENSPGNYSLGGRAALTKPKPDPDCLEVGIVVVEVKVNRDGIVTYASIAKGTTNNEECLTKKALQAARKTKWQPKADAPLTQKGKIIYDFRVQ